MASTSFSSQTRATPASSSSVRQTHAGLLGDDQMMPPTSPSPTLVAIASRRVSPGAVVLA